MSLKKNSIAFVQTNQKRKDVRHMETSRANDRKRKESPFMEMSRDSDQKSCVYK